MLSRTRGEETTVRFFEELYAIVVGLGLAVAVEQIVDLGREGIPVLLVHVPTFLAYLNFAFPLAHSSVRYLDLAYVDNEAGPPTKERVLLDLVLGLGHFLWLIGLSFLITRPTAFTILAMVLLAGRPLRDGILRLGGNEPLEFDRKVARVHLVSVAALAALLAATSIAGGSAQAVVRIGALVVSLGFAIGLYLYAFNFFFGDESAVSERPPSGTDGSTEG